jgi:hypothetical protein
MQPTITEGLRAVVSNAIEQVNLGEMVHYDVFMTTIPTPEGMGLGVIVMLAIPAIELGNFMIAPIMFNTPVPPAAEVDKQTQETMTALRAKKAELIAQANNGNIPGVPMPGQEKS